MTAVNPVLRRELLERWRGRRAFVVVTVYVLALAAVVQLLYWVGRASLDDRFGEFTGVAAGPALGRFLFENLLGLVLLLVLFIAPGYAAAQISGERERRTLALLQVTLVRPWQIVAGKLGASVAWLLLLVVAALPFGATAFFFGGVAVVDLVRAGVTIVGLAVAVAGIGLGISSLARRTTASVVVTYAVVLALTLGTVFAAAVEAVLLRPEDGSFERPVSLYLNPFYGLADAARVDGFGRFGPSLPSVLAPFGSALPRSTHPDVIGPERHRPPPPPPGFPGPRPVEPPVVEPAIPEQLPPDEAQEGSQPVWLVVLGAYLLCGAAGCAVATRRVGAGRTRRRRTPAATVDDTPATPPAAQ